MTRASAKAITHVLVCNSFAFTSSVRRSRVLGCAFVICVCILKVRVVTKGICYFRDRKGDKKGTEEANGICLWLSVASGFSLYLFTGNGTTGSVGDWGRSASRTDTETTK